jgi:acetylornithine/succinyldiaminopimelate/putrescine aminotransferase
LQPGDHGTTFGGSPVPAAAALAHLRVRDATDLDAHVVRAGARLRAGLAAAAERRPDLFAPPRGIGLMLGLPVRPPHTPKAFVDAGRDRERILLNGAGENTLRFVPPLIISEAEIDEALVRFARTVARVAPAP